MTFIISSLHCYCASSALRFLLLARLGLNEFERLFLLVEADLPPNLGPRRELRLFGLADLTLIEGQSPSVDVTATNNTGSAATLYGWIDYNGDGTFAAAEQATIAVPTGSTGVTFTLNWYAGRISLSYPELLTQRNWSIRLLHWDFVDLH